MGVVIMKRSAWLAVLCLCFTFSGRAYGLDPYDNVALPQGWFLSLYPSYYQASTYTDNNGNKQMDPGIRAYQTGVRFTYYDKTLLPKTWAFSIILPAGQKEQLGISDSGIGDLTLTAGYWFVDDPASKTYFAAGMFVDVPTGGYDKTKKSNMGSNMYKFRPAIGFAKDIGKLHTEGILKYNIYTENKDTGVRPGSETIAELYAGYFVRLTVLLGGLLNATFGQNKTVNGRETAGSGLRRYQAGPSVYWVPAKGFSITVDALSEFGTKNTAEGYLLMSRFSWKL